MDIDATTKLVLLLGHPVQQSLSPLMLNQAFEEFGLPVAYLAADVTPPSLPAAIAGMRALGLIGANITVPHKTAVLPLLDELDEEAARIGAVNVIVNIEGRLRGHNTDAPGFLAALEGVWSGDLRESTVLLFGAGGAARAVTAGLARRSVKELLIWNRTKNKAADLARDALAWGISRCCVIDSVESQIASAVDVVVHATSAGWGKGVKKAPLNVDVFGSETFLMDLQYGRSTVVEAALARGMRAVDGLEMLVRQAALAFELWTGLPGPEHTMRSAAAVAYR
ncbi:MAG: shikimate dehydrogenase [Actinobacteria bacterium]|nr:shikimate dehydrogenase [Actinomycetota bacterium]